MLSEAHRQELRDIIQDEIRKLEDSLAGLKDQTAPIAPDSSVGRLTRMDSIVQQSTAERILIDTRQRLNQLRERLNKIDSPNYGLCAKCKKPIAIARLKAAPDAVFCIECAEAVSRKKR